MTRFWDTLGEVLGGLVALIVVGYAIWCLVGPLFFLDSP